MKKLLLILTLGLSIHSFGQPSDYVAYYPFNGDATDGSGNGNDATVNEATLTTDRFGNPDAAYLFDGVDDYISVAFGLPTDDISISLWVRAASFATDMGVIDLSSSSIGTDSWIMYNDVSGNWEAHFDTRDSGGAEYNLEGASPSNDWVHLVMVREGTSLTFTINNSSRFDMTIDALSTAHNELFIGNRSLDGGDYFDGTIDDVQLFDRALTSAEIGEIYNEGAFITTWQTTTASESITIPTSSGETYDYRVDWGDGTVTMETGDATHTYAIAGTYSVSIIGTFPRIYFNNGDDGQEVTKIQSIEQWGNIAWSSMNHAFYGCSNLTYNATDAPDLSLVTNMERAFNNCDAFTGDLNSWDVSNVQNFGDMFFSADAFNGNLAVWDMSSATNLAGMFFGCTSFNQDIGDWNISQVTGIGQILDGASSFDYELGSWDISSLTSAGSALSGTGMSADSYDVTLIGWASLDEGETQIPTGLTFDATGVEYCEGVLAKNELETTYSWTITDAGQNCADLVAYYSLSGDATDNSGNGNTGIVEGSTATLDRFGNADGALRFDGVDDEINITRNSQLEPTSAITIMAWGRVNSETNSAWIQKRFNESTSPFHSYRINGTGQLFDIQTSNGEFQVADPDDLVLDKWKLVVGTYDGSSLKIYVDGTLKDEISATGTIEYTTTNLRIGYATTGQYFDGDLDDIRIYNRALSEAEIQDIYELEQVELSDGLVAYYPFNGNGSDESGTGNDASNNGASFVADRLGNSSSAVNLDGDDFITVADNSSLDLTQFTLSGWMYLDSAVPDGGFYNMFFKGEQGDPANTNYAFSVTSDQNLSIFYEYGSGTNVTLLGTTSIATQTWYHFLSTYDGTDLKLYINGVEEATLAESNAPETSDQALYIGTNQSNSTFVNGSIDDLRIYNRALTSGEVNDLYEAERPLAITEGLIASYEFTGDANDGSGNGNNGTVFEATLTTDRFGNTDEAYAFDGIDDGISIATLGQTPSNLTMIAWFKYPSGGADGTHQIFEIVGSGALALFENQAQTVINLNNNFITVEQATTSDIWHQMAFTYDGSTVVSYLDGEIYNSNSNADGLNYLSTAMNIGNASGSSNFFQGDIDDIQVYSRALSEGDIRETFLTNDWTDIITFSFDQQAGAASIDDEARTIAIEVEHGANIHTLTPNFTTHPAFTVVQGGIEVISGSAEIDFTDPVTLEVVYTDNTAVSAASYVVTVTQNHPTSINFEKVTSTPLTEDLSWDVGSTWADFNNDNYPDVFITNWDFNDTPVFSNSLYLNDQSGSFTDVSGVLPGVSWEVANAIDFDNDGDIDIVGASEDNIWAEGANKLFFVNNGAAGSFTREELTVPTSIDAASRLTWNSGWADYDNDGDLDVLHIQENDDGTNKFFVNNGDGTFSENTSINIVSNSGTSLDVSWADINNDGYMDLFVANNTSGSNSSNDELYINNGDGSFIAVTSGDIVNDNVNSEGISWGDINNDGYIDLLVTGLDTVLMYLNNGDDTFTTLTNNITQAGLRPIGSAMGDYDNDGDLDIFLTELGGINRLWVNTGSGTFDETTGTLINESASSWSANWTDYNRDGQLDLLVTNANQKNYLYRNTGTSNNYIGIKLNGTESNKFGIGARIVVKAELDGAGNGEFTQTRQVLSSSGSRSQQGNIIHFGLSDAPIVENITIYWPSGRISSFNSIATNQYVELAENDGLLAYYPYNGNVDDESINNLPGAEEGGVSLTTDRLENAEQAFLFDGVDDRIISYNIPQPSLITVAGWLQTSADYSGGYANIIDFPGALGLGIGVGNQLSGVIQIAEGDFVAISGTGTINDGNWHHVAMSYDGANLKLYLDGNVVADVAEGAGSIHYSSAPQELRVGYSNDGVDRWFTGSIDEVRIYDSALSDGEILAIYDAERSEAAFITTWETTSDNESINIPIGLDGEVYDYTVDWGDGTIESNITADVNHTYSTAGTYTVSITGTFPRIYFNNGADGQSPTKIRSIEQWGDIQWTSMQGAFYGCSNMQLNATDAPDLSSVTSLRDFFRDASSINPSSLNNWDVSTITNMNRAFSGASSFNGDISDWQVGNVSDFGFIFFGASSFNQNVGGWDITGASFLQTTFGEATSFNQDISSWDVSGITSMREVFLGATAFNQDLASWDVSLVQDMTRMFQGATSFDQSLAAWDISSISSMGQMLDNSGMTSNNYDATLRGWATLDAGETQIPTGIELNATGLIYCDAAVARTTLQDTYDWTISGDTESCTINDGLVAYYPFNGNVNDESGNGNNGTNNGAFPIYDRTGEISMAYLFTGTGDHISLGDVDFIGGSSNVTISWWQKLDVTDGADVISIGNFRARLSAGNLAISPFIDGSATSLGTMSVTAGLWQHIAFTYDGANTRLYLDGTLVDNLAITGAFDTNTGTKYIGTFENTGNYLDGSVDELRIYDRTLSEADVTSLFLDGLPPPSIANISTKHGIAGTRVQVYGSNFFGTDVMVEFDGGEAFTPTVVNSKYLYFDLPSRAVGFTSFMVTNQVGTSPSQDFYVLESNTGLALGQENLISASIASATEVHADDMNKDGRPDVMAWSFANGDLHFFLNNGDGTFSESFPYTGSSSISRILTGDIDKDGNKDIVFFVADGISDGIYILNGNGDGTFMTATEVLDVSNPRDIALGDINNSGLLDIVFSENGETKWSRNEGSGVFDTPEDVSSVTSISKLDLVDIENDGIVDIVQIASGSSENNYVFNSEGGLNFSTLSISTNPTNGSDELAIGDLDNDGFGDWVAGAFNDHNVDLHYNTGTAFSPSNDDLNGPDTYLSVSDLHIADIDADGDNDILSAFFNSDNVVVYLNNGSGDQGANVFATTEVIANQIDASSITTADLDSDGDLDILIAREDGNVVWIESEGALTLTGIDQAEGAGGDELTLFGSGFDLDPDKNIVKVGNVDAEVTQVSGDGKSLKFIVPFGLSTSSTTVITLTVDEVTVELSTPFDILLLTQISNLTATPSGTTVNLSWDDHLDGLVSEYEIYRSTTPGASTLLTTVTTAAYEDTGLSEGTNYYYRIKASDGGTNMSGFSKEVSAAIQSSSGTDVSGNLIESDTWTIAGSPYNIVGDVGVPSAFSLTIDPGVVVNYSGDFKILVFGQLNVNGVASNPVTFNGNSTEGSSPMIEIRQSNLDNSNISYAIVNGPQGFLAQGQDGEDPTNSGSLRVLGATIDNSTIETNYVPNNQPIPLILDNSQITNSVVEGEIWDHELIEFIQCTISSTTFRGTSMVFNGVLVQSSTIDNGINKIEIVNSKWLDNRHVSGSVTELVASNSVFVNSPLRVTRTTLNNSLLVATAETDSVVIDFIRNSANTATSEISNSQFIGEATKDGIYYNASPESGFEYLLISNSLFNNLSKGFINVSLMEDITFTSNNFLNSTEFHIDNGTSNDISAQSNYWDSNSATTIADKIFDATDDLELGTVDFSSRLSTHSVTAPISAPENVVQADDGGGGVDITWSANEESDVAGYRVHYGEFDGFEYENVMDVGTSTATNITGLTISDQVAVTAYDVDRDGINDLTDGNESWYAIAATPPDSPLATAASDVTIDSFVANWGEIEGASSYRLDVASDNSFSSLVSGFENLQVFGATQSVIGLNVNTTYYYRVRAENAAGISSNSNTIAQTTRLFVEEFAGQLPGLNFSDVDWGDYDNDSDLDIAISGQTDGGFVSQIYENTGSGFTEVFAGELEGLANSSISWGDYDRDGDLDILLTGTNPSSNSVSLIYNNSGSGFTEVFAGSLDGASESKSGWFDYDNDGDLDIILTGFSGGSSTNISKIYENSASGFSEVAAGQLEGIRGDVVSGDLDNDGDLDILISGFNGSERVSRLYQNNVGSFSEIYEGQLIGILSGSIAASDYDNDGDLDVIITGSDTGTTGTSSIYNNAGNTFTEVFDGQIEGVNNSGVTWGDFDGDGDSDIIVSGDGTTDRISKLYLNSGTDFTEPIPDEFTKLNVGSIAASDYDNDGDLDVILTGENTDGLHTEIYENNSSSSNAAPSAPTNLNSSIAGGNVTFSWDHATDDTTPQDGLSYEIYVGTATGGEDVRSPLSNLATGFRKVVRRGDIQGTSWTITGLAIDTYFWSVQAIDAGYAGGAFATEQTFDVTTTASSEALITSFSIPDQIGESVIDDTNETVTVSMPTDTDVTSLTPSISISAGANVSPASGVAQNFTNAVTYTVTAEDGTTTKLYDVTVQLVESTEALITGFTIPDQVGESVINDADETIAVTMPASTDVTSLTPTIAISANASVNPMSGVARDFTNAVSYTVTAEDGVTTKTYQVSVTVEASTEAFITSFTIANQEGETVIDEANGTISLNMPNGTEVDNLTPNIVISANATVSPMNGVAQDFTNVVTYTVTAEDGITNNTYDVSISVLPDESGLIAYYPFTNSATDNSGNGYNGTENGTVAYGTDRLGEANSALNLEGSGSITLGGTENFDFGDDITVVCWMYANSFITTEPELTSNGQDGNGFDFKLSTGTSDDTNLRTLKAEVFGGGNFISSGELGLGEWYHVAFTYSRDEGFVTYVDGLQFGTAGGGSTISPSTRAIEIGTNWDGFIDELRIFSSALSENEIRTIFNDENPIPNNTPTDISLTNDQLDEGLAANTFVGEFSTTDADATDLHTYSLVAGDGDTDNGSFIITGENGNQLSTNEIFDFETKSSYSVRVQTDDGREGGTYAEIFTIDVTNVNETPSFNAFTGTVSENAAIETIIGTISGSDPDGETSLTFSLEDNTSNFDLEVINGTSANLRVLNSAFLDYETRQSVDVQVRVEDSGTLGVTQTLSFDITNVNPQADDFTFSNSSILAGAAGGTTIGTLSVTGEEEKASFGFTIEGSSSEFTLNGADVSINEGVSSGSYNLTINAINDVGSTGIIADQVQNTFVIEVTTINTASSVSFGTSVSNYRIIGVPATSASVSTVFPDLSSVDQLTGWRIVSYSNGSFSDLNTNSTMTAGRGYWFLSSESTRIELGGLTPIQTAEVNVQLVSGWNLISNPFLETLDVSQAIAFNVDQGVISSDDVSSVFSYNESITSSLPVFQGGWIQNRTSGNLTLRLPNPSSTSSSRQAPEPQNVENSWYADSENWQLILHMQNGDRTSNLCAVGMRPDALPDADHTDLFGPPLIAAENSFRIVESSGLVRNFKPYSQAQEWDFSITAPAYNFVTLSWDTGIASSIDQKLYLYDPIENVSYNMAAINAVQLPANSSFQVLLGDAIDHTTIGIPLMVYPNPASDVLYVEFFVEGEEKEIQVEMTIFGLDGSEIAKRNEQFLPNSFGRFEINDLNLSSGIFFIQVNYNGRSSQPQKLIVK